MSNDPYQIGDVVYWKEGNITRLDANSLAFKKKVYGNYNYTSIMSDKDSQKSGIQFKLNPDDTTISKKDSLAEKKRLDSFEGWYSSQFRKGGLTWADRHNMQKAAQAYRRLEDINNRIIIIDSILSNPINIERWKNEAYVKKQVEMENQRIENQRLQEIENQRLQEIENKRIENQRLMELENQRIEIEKQKPIIEPEIIPAVVASSSLIPLAIIAFLLINSRKGKK